MASRNIKGITIEINGETTKLEKALKNVDNVVYKTNSELKNLNSALRLDPKNTELLSQKYELLKKNIDESKKRLDTLKEAQRQMGDYNSLTEEQKENYRALSVEITKSETSLKSLEKEFKNFGSVGVQQLKAVGQEMKTTGDKISSVGSSMSKSVTAPIAGVMAAGVTYNAQMEKYQTALTTLTGSAENANKIIEQIKSDAAKTPFDVAGLTSANQLLLSTGLGADEARETILALGNAIAATGGGDDELSRMAVNLQQIKNVGSATALDIKQFAYAGIDIYGMLADYLGITKEEASEMKITWDDLNGALINASKEGGKYFNAMDKQSETFNGKISNLKDSIGVLTGELAVALMPILDKLITFITGLMEKFNNLSPQMQSTISTILLIAAAIGPVVLIVGKIISAIGTIMTILPALGGVITFLTGPIGIAIAAVVAVIAIVTTLYNKCEWFRNGVNAIINFLKNLFVGIIDFVKNNWQALLLMLVNPFAGAFKLLYDNCDGFRNFIDNFVKKIKNFFVNLGDGIKNAVTGMINTIASLPGKIAAIPGKIVSFFASLPSSMLSIGKNVVSGIWSGISSSYEWIKSKITGWVGNVVKFIKKLFGIHSPSKVMKEQIGENLGLGIVEGIDDTVSDVENAMKGLNSKVQASVNPIINPNAISNQLSDNSALSNIFSIDYKKLASAMVEEMTKVKIELDDEVAGKFVKKTVAAEIYS